MALSKTTLHQAPKRLRCSVCIALRDLPKPDGDQLVAWLEDPTIEFATIARECAADPDTPNLGSFALSRHARGDCDSGTRGRRS